MSKLALYPLGTIFTDTTWREYQEKHTSVPLQVQGDDGTQWNPDWIIKKSISSITLHLRRDNGDTQSRSVNIFPVQEFTDIPLLNRKMICVDSADVTAVLPRICGFDKIIGIRYISAPQNTFSTETINTVASAGHAYNCMDGMAYDATARTEMKTTSVLRRLLPVVNGAKTISEYEKKYQSQRKVNANKINLIKNK